MGDLRRQRLPTITGDEPPGPGKGRDDAGPHHPDALAVPIGDVDAAGRVEGEVFRCHQLRCGGGSAVTRVSGRAVAGDRDRAEPVDGAVPGIGVVNRAVGRDPHAGHLHGAAAGDGRDHAPADRAQPGAVGDQ